MLPVGRQRREVTTNLHVIELILNLFTIRIMAQNVDHHIRGAWAIFPGAQPTEHLGR